MVGVEIDHDSATAGLEDYARWLEALALPQWLRLSITALPTWTSSPSLRRVSNAVDELVLQVHAIRAPTIFDAAQAHRWILRFSWCLGDRTFRVALPTYRVEIDGDVLGADPKELQRFVHTLNVERPRGLEGFLWFRLPVSADTAAWAAPTLDAVILGTLLKPSVKARLVPDGPGLFNVVVENDGTLAESWPELRFTGDIESVDITAGYVREREAWTAPSQILSAGEERTVGWVRGENVGIEVH